ncbi:tRNA (uridine(34)/cytosine(34)/5-carboxymethylaminomethyluridine(34)-2'-O)-methyltransferase TrmL [Denitratisoma sp. DHT3]|uniref:tRNA (cytidine(34)-2'-O)-methyltransferase n=1 Tax=Denitratisoma sp. DHT3 TaxID=1981880 RepID=UPI001198C950|nr:tRNA (cytidine(34)-2'-O)-methyltransferase [Denitratisoma sp. DHT3]QDX81714.1 tRNA (uridine(34)/cytosine(34)/5-carboxymethylaminomethyluridine(34)-2'-O)-methyltransferase TrmL [Denitratisoma sp. DHT3]
MFDIVLYQPEIPPNTGNILRLAANSGSRLNLVEPLGFSISEAAVRRAGMDYAELAEVVVHENWPACRASLARRRVFALSTRGTVRYDQVSYQPGDAFLFGPETSGLPQAVLDEIPPERRLRLPMVPGNRSINLSNTVAILVFEAWRQQGFTGGG